MTTRATMLLLAGALVLPAAGVRAQVSPGPLATAHRDLDGALQCFQCHARTGPSGSMDQKCLACHTEIAWIRSQRRSNHARVAKDACSKCHPDHAGREFQLIAWDTGSPGAFDHQQAGWALEGKHATLECRSCHKPGYQRSRIASMIRVKDRGRTWLGLDPACATCHEDPHRDQLGSRCLACHDVRAWKPAPRFDHAKTKYPLTGEHAGVACAKCHQATGLTTAHDAAGVPVPVYKPLPHAECSSCHRDPHAGRFGAGCASCHTTASFQRINQRGFDHDRTRYPLRGRHAALACATCHDPRKAWGAKPPFAACGSCHRDAHGGQATLAGKAVDCAACHDVQGFRPSTFSVARHRATTYPLEGRHAQLECAACHPKRPAGAAAVALGSSRVAMRPAHARCMDCHANDHGNQLASRTDQGACEACHKVTGWRSSAFSTKDHERLRLALHGRHAEIACAACHGAKRPGMPPPASAAAAGRAGFVFALAERECVACHADPHRGRFAPGGKRTRAAGCLDCHGVDAFRPSAVDVAAHAAYDFALEGAHRATPCQACHAELKAAPAASSLVLAAHPARSLPFAETRTGCASCHRNPHDDQFQARRDRGACESCHGVDAFVPASRFDHNRQAGFELKGAHARVACASCHRLERGADGPERMIYRPTPTRCESCHADAPTLSPRGALSPNQAPREVGASSSLLSTREAGHAVIVP